MAVTEHRFRVMASDAQVLVHGGDQPLAEEAEDHLRRLERRWSRFIPNSDISRLNRSQGRCVSVAPETLVLVSAMVEAWHLTGGRCDPSVLPALVEAGYAASIEDAARRTELDRDAAIGADLDAIRIDPDAGRVALPPRCCLDPGGIGKGLAADLVSARLVERGATGALVSIGGDLATSAAAPDPDRWLVSVEHPHRPEDLLCTVRVDGGGVATSSTLTRRWRHGGVDRHHLIDPGTGRQAVTDLDAVTVSAATGWEAEALATGALLAGSTEVLAYLTGHDVAGIATTADGRHLSTPGLLIPGAEALAVAGTSA